LLGKDDEDDIASGDVI